MLHVRSQGGLLADDCPPPIRTESCFALAKDDATLFTKGETTKTHQQLRELDMSFNRCGILQNEDKDVFCAKSTTCIGIDVEDGRYLALHSTSMLNFFSALVYMLSLGASLAMSPLQFAAILGIAQWHVQLNRPV